MEAYGILLAEALCCGSPVVITNVGGISETISLAKNNLNSDEEKFLISLSFLSNLMHYL